METVLIELKNKKAYNLLQNMEDLELIKLIKTDNEDKENLPIEKSNVSQFKGSLKLTDKQYNDFQEHAKNIRSEWQKDF